jgi:tetratricopeptide (TPR) repeat protein
MIRFLPALMLGTWLPLCAPVMGQEPVAENPVETMHAARRLGWQLATLTIDNLKAADQKNFPGIEAWLKDFEKATKGIDLKVAPAKWPVVDVDALLTNNPNFWQAHYEIAPGDPGLIMLHAGLLLSVGEANRAANMLVVGLQRPAIPTPVQQGLQIALANTQAFAQKSNTLVIRGTEFHDKSEYAEALKEYKAALELWPQNGWAYYEVGYTLREQEMVRAGEKKLPASTVIVNSDRKNSPEVEAAFAKARKYDPFQWKAYQGSDQDAIRGLMALTKKGMPAWQKLGQDPMKKADDQVLEDLANACQEANIHDLALVTRQILVARRKGYDPADHPFISKSLRKLAPGKQTEEILTRLVANKKLSLRQLVVPEPEK